MSSIFYPDSITITDRTLQMCYKKASPTKKFKFCLYENAEVYFAQFPMEQKSGESPLMVARLSLLFLYPNDTNGEVGFAQFPMVQKKAVPFPKSDRNDTAFLFCKRYERSSFMSPSLTSFSFLRMALNNRERIAGRTKQTRIRPIQWSAVTLPV